MVSFASTRKPKLSPTTPAVDCPVCLNCSGRLIEIRGQMHCTECHALWDSVSDGQRMAVAMVETLDS